MDAAECARRLLAERLPLLAGTYREPEDESLTVLFEAAEALKAEPGQASEDPYEQVFGEIVADKFRRQGFKV
ncbi:MAG: hypothetical protein IT210_02590 [Armatimonadetes bacterium]|nr:hypothetical protein [Armatimonadota bacterium]